MKYSRFVICAVGMWLLAGLACADVVPTLSIRQVLDDSGIITKDTNYLMAINFWNKTGCLTPNGVQFITTNRSADKTGGGYSYRFTTDIGSLNFHAGGNNGYNVEDTTSDSYKLYSGMVYNTQDTSGQKSILTVDGLTPGEEYTLTIYSRRWDTNANNRQSTLSFDSNTGAGSDSFQLSGTERVVPSINLNQNDSADSWSANSGLNNDRPVAIDYKFTASSAGSLTTSLACIDTNQNWHLYGFSLSQDTTKHPVLRSNGIINGSFENDHPIESSNHKFHGYCVNDNGNYYTIAGWASNDLAHVGLAPTWKDETLTTIVCTDFSNSVAVPDGKQAVFMQSINSSSPVSLWQTLDVTPDQEYVLWNSVKRRNTGTNPGLTISIDDAVISQTSVTNTSPYKLMVTPFTPTRNDAVLKFTTLSPTSGEANVLLDDVNIYPVYSHYSDNFDTTQAVTDVKGPTAYDSPTRFTTFGETSKGYDFLRKTENADLYQISNDGKMLFRVNRDNQPAIQFDHNFTDFFDGDALYTLKFNVNPLFQLADGTEVTNDSGWAAVVFGDTRGVPANVNTSKGSGILFRNNGKIQVFDKTTIKINSLDIPLELRNEDGSYDVTVYYHVDAFDGTSPVDVVLYVDDTYVTGYTVDGFTANYISLLAAPIEGGDTTRWALSSFDNFSISSSELPEPGTLVMLLLGGVTIFFLRRRAK